MTTPQQISSPPAALAEVQVNENLSALGQAFVWAHDVTADTGLTVGLAGGTFDETTVAADTLACTDNETNYIAVHRTTLVASVEVGTDAVNWDDTATYGRIARAVFASGVLTWHDERYSTGGIFDHLGGGSGLTDGDKGDITVSGGATTWTIDAGAVTYAKMQDVSATARVLGRKTAGSGDVEECTLSEVLDLIGSAAQGDILYRDAAGWARLPAGTAGQGLKTAGAAANPAWADQPMVMVPFFPGVPTASQLLGIFPAPAGITTITFASAIAGSAGKALTAATAQTDIDVRKNATTSANGTSVGTVRFAAAGTVPTFIAASGFTLTGGTDWLSFWAPGTPDATLADFAIALYATRS
jgi:hypothetical protein